MSDEPEILPQVVIEDRPVCSMPKRDLPRQEILVKAGETLVLKPGGVANIWHRTIHEERQYVEAPSEYLEVSNVWRTGDMGATHLVNKVEVAADGTLTMPEVTPEDSGEYYTYYFKADEGQHVYEYYDVAVHA